METHGRPTAITMLAGAGFLGALAGVGSIATTAEGRGALNVAAAKMAVAVGLRRQRPPQEGDFWTGCNDARAAGTAPIYRAEPGYRSDMDGDNDGVACEPIRD